MAHRQEVARLDDKCRRQLKLRVAYSLLPPSFLSLWYTDRMFLLFTSCKIGVKGKKDEYMASLLEGRPLICPFVQEGALSAL